MIHFESIPGLAHSGLGAQPPAKTMQVDGGATTDIQQGGSPAHQQATVSWREERKGISEP